MNPPLFSVIIPVRNGASTLPLVFRCLSLQTLPADRFEAVVIDDGSTDGTADFLRGSKPPFGLTVLTHSVSRGRSQARNYGHRRSRGRILVFLDGDMLPVPEWLECYQRAFSADAADVIAGCRHNIESPAGVTDRASWLAGLLHVSEADLLRNGVAAQFQQMRALSQPGQYPAVSSRRLAADIPVVCERFPSSILCAYSFVTSNVAVRREMFERTTGFDPFVRRAQDIELGMRLWECGCRFVCLPHADAYHLYWPSEERLLSEFEKLAFFYRHPARIMVAMFARGPDDSVVDLIPRGGPETFDEELLLKYPGAAFDFRYSGSQAAWYFSHLFEFDETRAARCLEDALQKGLATGWRDGAPRYDLDITANWMRTFGAKTGERTDRASPPADIPPRECAGNWEALIPAEVAASLPPGLRWDVPLPWGHCEQWEPYAQGLRFDPRRSVLRQVPLVAGTEAIRLSFAFRLKGSAVAEDDPPEAGACLTPSCPASALPALQFFLDQMGKLAEAEPQERVQRIHRWVARNFPHRDNCFAMEQIVEAGFGNEFQRARLFADLCRLARMPARERVGAVLYLGKSGDAELCCRRQGVARNPLASPWVETYLPGQGWISVDFPEESESWQDLHSRARYRIPAGSFDLFAGYGSVGPARWARIPALFGLNVRVASTLSKARKAEHAGRS